MGAQSGDEVTWFDTEHGHETQTPAWVHPPQRRSLVPLVLTMVFSLIAGYVLWQLASGLSTPQPSVTIASSGDEWMYQQTAEAAQDETNRLLVMLIDTTLLVNPSPTPTPTKHPTNVPSTKVALPSCEPNSLLANGTACKPYPTPTPVSTVIPTWTPEPCATVFARPVATYSERPCAFMWTPTPGYTVGG